MAIAFDASMSFAFSVWLLPDGSIVEQRHPQSEYDDFAVRNGGVGEITGKPDDAAVFLLACGGVHELTTPKWSYEYSAADEPKDGFSNLAGFRCSSISPVKTEFIGKVPNHRSVSFDSKASGTADGASLTFSHAVVSATNGAITAFFHSKTSGGTQSVTYNGNALTQRETQDIEDITEGMFDLVPQSDTGAHNIVMSLSGTVDSLAGASIALTGVDQVAPRSVTNKGTANNNAPTLTLTGGATDEVALTAMGWHDTPTNTIDATWTTGNVVLSGSVALQTAYKTGAASVTRTDSLTGAAVWGMMGGSYKAASAGGDILHSGSVM